MQECIRTCEHQGGVGYELETEEGSGIKAENGAGHLRADLAVGEKLAHLGTMYRRLEFIRYLSSPRGHLERCDCGMLGPAQRVKA